MTKSGMTASAGLQRDAAGMYRLSSVSPGCGLRLQGTEQQQGCSQGMCGSGRTDCWRSQSASSVLWSAGSMASTIGMNTGPM